jgi:hypothetical protein
VSQAPKSTALDSDPPAVFELLDAIEESLAFTLGVTRLERDRHLLALPGCDDDAGTDERLESAQSGLEVVGAGRQARQDEWP